MGPFGAIERPWKPFNPILGETFEFRKPKQGITYIAEQVSAGAGGFPEGAGGSGRGLGAGRRQGQKG